MKELSLNLLDVAENSVKAGATLTELLLTEEQNRLTMVIRDDGCGMSAETVAKVIDPFYTTRTTRKVGLGVPFLKMEAEQTGGSLTVSSTEASADPICHGTTLTAVFYTDHVDFTPLGDVISTVTTLIQGHPDTDFLFLHTTAKGEVRLATCGVRSLLGEDVCLGEYEVIKWIEAYLKEQYGDLQGI
ncbi:MAG: sensor histidine kinase [Clostridia bacterium]|nr:sensor histidine kinase [Clostridia bacterium]